MARHDKHTMSVREAADDAGVARRATYGILWDVDGVIIDSAEQHRQAWALTAREQSLPYSDADFWATFGMRNSDVIPRLYRLSGPPERIATLGERKEATYRALLEREAAALPGARELMRAFHVAGYRQALASSAPPPNQEAIVRLLGLDAWLQGRVSGEQVRHGKPAPDIFLAAAQVVDVPPERCLVLEDAPAGVAAARAGGMRCIAVRRPGQPDAPGIEAADLVVNSLLDVTIARVDALLGIVSA